jgi:trans-2,3-dihydro-3-hydroxyanthranilate isomerase
LDSKFEAAEGIRQSVKCCDRQRKPGYFVVYTVERLMPVRKFHFAQLDVFTSRPLEGNQLAVVSDARGLSDDEMQKLARETNLSETTFILPREDAVEPAEGHKVRIFTVNEELPFAGHPTLGTAWYLRQNSTRDEIVLDLKVGRVPVRFEQRDGQLFGEMRQSEPQFGRTCSHAEVAEVLGLPVAELDEDLPIQTVSTGLPFTMVPFRSLATLQKLNVSWGQMASYLATLGNPAFFYFVCRETVDPKATLHARMIFYNGEDPATGSAAGCCAAWGVKYGVLRSEQQGLIEQGMETRRPSWIYIRAARSSDTVTNVRVGGNVVQVINGEVTM